MKIIRPGLAHLACPLLVNLLMSTTGQTEPLTDPEDEDAWVPATQPARTEMEAPAGTIFAARSQLRLDLDLGHEGDPEDVTALSGQALAWIEHRPRSRIRLRAGARILYRMTARDAASVHRNDLEVDALDTCLTLSVPRLDIQGGVITEVWGATDLVNPNDVLAPRDLRTGPFLDPETSRLPLPMLKAVAHVGDLSLAGLWMPVFEPHRVDLFGSDVALFGPLAPGSMRWLGDFADSMFDASIQGVVQPALLQTRRPRPFVDSSFGARIARPVRGWDLAIQYAWLHERLPRFRIRSRFVLDMLDLFLTAPESLTTEQRQRLAQWLIQDPLPVEASYRRHHHAGLSLSGSVWNLAVNLDLAFQSRQAVALESPEQEGDGQWFTTVVDSQVAAYTLGLTYTRGDELLVSLEWWHQLHLDLVGEGRRDLFLGGPQHGGCDLLVRYQLYALNLTGQLLVHSDLLNRAVILTPQLSYRWGDHLATVVGANIFEGIQASLPGRLDGNDQAYVAVEGYL